MRLTKSILNELDGDNSNLVRVKDHVVFRAPKHSKDLYLALRLTHIQTGMSYVQVMQLPVNVARGMVSDVGSHAELDRTDGPDF